MWTTLIELLLVIAISFSAGISVGATLILIFYDKERNNPGSPHNINLDEIKMFNNLK
jgi:hypothetical protein